MNIPKYNLRNNFFLPKNSVNKPIDRSVIVLENDDPLICKHDKRAKTIARVSSMLRPTFITDHLLSYSEKAVVGLFLLFYVWVWLFPQYTVEAAGLPFTNIEPGELPTTEVRKPDEVRWVTVTAYSSTPDQTDSTPFHTATGEHVYWGGVAANSLTFNSRVRFPGYHNEKMFRVNDRMHRRFSDRVDIWFPTRAEAQDWGKRRVEIEIWYY